MPLRTAIIVWGLVLAGAAVMFVPLLPTEDGSESVDANIRGCPELFKKGAGVIYATRIDQPPGEIRFEINDSSSEKMVRGYRAACGSGRPVRIYYWQSGITLQEVYRVRGIQGIDGTDYFTVADSLAVDNKYIYHYAIGIGLSLWLLAYLGYKSAKIEALKQV
jgi:hypothetical protein